MSDPAASTQIRRKMVENSLHAKVCAGLMTLAAAKAVVATNRELLL